MPPSKLALLAVATTLLAPAAAHAAAPPAAHGAATATQVVARQGDETLTAADVGAMLAQLDPQTRTRLLATPGGVENLVRSRLATDALLAEANGRKWADRPEIAHDIAAARDSVVAKTYLASVSAPDAAFPTEAAIASAYEANKSQFVVPRQYQLSQIVIPGADDPASRKHAQATARTFPAASATDIGWLPENRLVPAIRDTVQGLSVGAAAAVHLDDGWHILKLTATKPAATLALAQVHDQVAGALRRERAEQNARAYLSALEGRQHAQINEIALSAAVGK